MAETILVDQATANPTRKIWAVALAAAIIAVIRTLLEVYFPGIGADSFLPYLQPWVEGAIVFAAGYFVRNKVSVVEPANILPKNAVIIQKVE